MTQWTIKNLTAQTKFAGLGGLKNTTLPVATRVLVCGEQILAVPGVSGGFQTALDSNSSTIILEVANFDAQEVARNSFRLGYRSEASKIYAENPSPDLPKLMIVRLNQELGDSFDWSLISRYTKTDQEPKVNSIKVDLNHLSRKLDNQGLEHWQPIIEAKLVFLGNYNPETQILTFNRFYQAISTQDNLLCEIIRMVGFGALAPQNLELSANPSYNKQYDNLNLLRACATKFGFDEVITRPFVSKKGMVSTDNSIQLLNPYSDLEPYVRDNLGLSLLDIYQKNLVKGEKQPRLFEINQTYSLENNQPKNTTEFSFVWDSTNPYLGTTLVQAIGGLCDGGVYKTEPVEAASFGVGYKYVYKNLNISLIQITNRVKKDLDIPLNRTIWIISVDLSQVGDWDLLVYKQFRDMSDYPVLSRDYSLTIPKLLSYTDLVNSIQSSYTESDKIISVRANERFEVDQTTDKLNITVRVTDYKTTPTKQDLDKLEQLLSQYQ